MTPEQFRAMLARHGGLTGHQILDPTTEQTDRYGRTTKQPTPSPRVRYTTPQGEITARQKEDGTFEVIDDPKGFLKDTDPTAPQKPIEVGGRLVEKQPDGTYKPVYEPPKEPKAADVREFPDGSLRERQPDGSWKPIEGGQKPAAPLKAPELGVPAARAGQRTDLAGVKAQYDAFVAGLNADKTLTDQQRTERLQRYIETVVTPAFDRANAEVAAEQERQAKRQETSDALAAAGEARAGRTEQRLSAADERRARLDEETLAQRRREFSYTAGQDAVKNALALLPATGSPLFGQQYAAALNTIASGGGPVTFTPEALSVPLPDLNALAAEGARRAAAMATLPVAGAQPAPAAPAPAPAPAPVGGVAPGARDQWWAR